MEAIEVYKCPSENQGSKDEYVLTSCQKTLLFRMWHPCALSLSMIPVTAYSSLFSYCIQYHEPRVQPRTTEAKNKLVQYMLVTNAQCREKGPPFLVVLIVQSFQISIIVLVNCAMYRYAIH